MRVIWALALLLLVPLAGLPAQATATAAPAHPSVHWWGPTAIGEGHHLRVGALVTNGAAATLTNAVVAFEVDLGRALTEAGWPSAVAGGQERISGFRLDPASVRVIAMTDLQQPAAGTSHGQLRAVALDRPATDPSRYEVPSLVFEGSLREDVGYHPAVNPVITVVWRIPEAFAPGATRAFMVYFDSVLSAEAKAAPDHAASLAGGDVLGLFWSGWGTTLHGFSRPVDGRASPLVVIGRDAGTTVTVATAAVGQGFRTVESFTLAAPFASKQVALPGTGPLLVKVTADRPVLGQMTSTGFVPSLDAGMAGREFVFAMTHAASWEQDTLYFGASTTGDAVATTIQVTRVDGAGPSLEYSLASGSNPWPYSIGARAVIDPGSCVRPIPDAPSPTLPFGPGLYRAKVTSGGKVLLQHQAVDALSQVPTLTGAPVGQDFRAALPWSDESSGAFCHVRTRTGALFATATEADASLTATSQELTFQAFPRGAANPPAARFPPGQAIAAGGQRGPFEVTARDSADRMLDLHATDPVQLLAGLAPAQVGTNGAQAPGAQPVLAPSSVPVVNGPLGGRDGGRAFNGYGPAVVVAAFDGTVVEVERRTNAGWSTTRVPMSRDASLNLEDAAAATALLDYRLTSNLPIIVHPSLASSGTLASIPSLLQAQPAQGHYRGYLVDLSSTDGDPITRTTAPGTPVRFPVTLTNLARRADGAFLADTVAVSLEVPSGWTAVLDGAPLGAGQERPVALGPGQVRALDLEMHPPDGIASETTAVAKLIARSVGNDRVSDQVQLVAFVKTVHKVAAWFDGPGGPKGQERPVGPDGTASFDLVVENLGSRPELVRVTAAFKGGAPGWEATLDGVTQIEAELEVPPDRLDLRLVLRVPPGSVDAEATAVVTVVAVQAPAARDAVQATATLARPADLSLEATRLTAFVLPGQDAILDMDLVNRGGGTMFSVESQGARAHGWGTPEVGLADSDQPLPTSMGDETLHLRLRVPAHPGALAGNATTVRVAVVTPKGQSAEEVFFLKVLARHQVLPTLGPLAAIGDGNLTFDVALRNAGNLDELLRIAPADLPAGWNLTVAPELAIARGATQQVQVRLLVPMDTTAGMHNVSLRLTARDGNVTLVPLPVLVDATGRAAFAPPQSLEGQPGETVSTTVPLTNDGNVPLLVRVVPMPGEGWSMTPPVAQTLQPGEHASLPVRWLVPDDAADGISVHRARVEFTVSSGIAPAPRDVSFTVDVGRPDLELADVAAVPGPAGALVKARVTNAGTRVATGFSVQLVGSSGDILDQVRVGKLAANQSLTVALVLAAPGTATIRVDGDGTVAEIDEGDNEAAVAAPRSAERAPAPGAAAIILLALATAFTRRPSQRDPQNPKGDP